MKVVTIMVPDNFTAEQLQALQASVSSQIADLQTRNQFLLNQVDWLTTTMMSLAVALEQPIDETMSMLPAHGARIMAELKALRK